jgi:glycosyltransferase involved in cell wall biosynthesis
MRKLLYFVTEDWFFVSHFLPMAQAARECGFDVVVATRAGSGGGRLAAAGLRVTPMTVERGALSPLRGVREFVQALRIVRAERPSVVHCIALRPVVIGGIAARLGGAGALVLAPTGLGVLWLRGGPVASLLRGVVRIVVGSLLHGSRTRYLFENPDDPPELGLDPDSPEVTIVGGAGVDPAEFPFVPEPPAPPLKVAVVARMIRPKGIAEAVAAAQRARAMGAAIELDLFGKPDPSNPLSIPSDLLQKWSATPGIVWRGHAADVADVWRTHHVALFLSSYREGVPRTLLEAAAAGRPIVTTDVVGCREVVRDGIEGILVPPGDIDAAAHALIKLAEDKGMRTRMGAAANARFRERFTVDAVKNAVRNLYRSLGSDVQ